MIYQPGLRFTDLRLALGLGLFQAAILAVTDFIAQNNKPWAYYAGAALGYTAAATGVPNAALTVYATGETLDYALFKSPDGSLVDVYQDGVLKATIDTYLTGSAWETLTLNLGAAVASRVDFVNRAVSPQNQSGIAWMGIGAFNLTGGTATLAERPLAMPMLVSFSLLDSDGDTSSLPLFVQNELTIAQIEAFVTAAAPLLDAVTGSVIRSASATLYPALPAGLKANPSTNVENQKGALLSFSTAGRYKHGVYVPGFLPTLFSGKNVNLVASGVGAFIDMFTTGIAPVTLRNGHNEDLVALARAVKAFRKG